jgi:hypothetical protein
MRRKVIYPFDVQQFRRHEGLTIEQFAKHIGKDVGRVMELIDGEHPALTSYEHGRLCRQFGRGKVSLYYKLPEDAINS